MNNYCKFVDEILVFGHWEFAPCCVPLPELTQPPKYSSVADLTGKDTSEVGNEILAKRSELKTRLSSNMMPIGCEKCKYLEKTEEKISLHNRLKGVVLSHSEVCDLKCTYCYQSKSGYIPVRKQKYSPVEVIRALVDEGAFEGRRYAFWGGGEPTLSPTFANDLFMLNELGFVQTINSNCTNYIPALEDFLRIDCDSNLVCSVDAGSESEYARVKRGSSYEVVWENIKRYSEISHNNVIVKYIFLPNNLKDLDAFKEKIEICGITKVMVDLDAGLSKTAINNISEDVIEALFEVADSLTSLGVQVAWAGNSFNIIENRNLIGALTAFQFVEEQIYFPFASYPKNLFY